MASGLINKKTLIPPFSFGRNVPEDEWDRMFPGGCKKSWESEEEYQGRIEKNNKLNLEKLFKEIDNEAAKDPSTFFVTVTNADRFDYFVRGEKSNGGYKYLVDNLIGKKIRVRQSGMDQWVCYGQFLLRKEWISIEGVAKP